MYSLLETFINLLERDNSYIFLYAPYRFMTSVIMTLHKFRFFVALSNVCSIYYPSHDPSRSAIHACQSGYSLFLSAHSSSICCVSNFPTLFLTTCLQNLNRIFQIQSISVILFKFFLKLPRCSWDSQHPFVKPHPS